MSASGHIYIIGAPRSGTTWLHTLVGSHPQVATFAELNTFHSYIRPLIQAWDREQMINETGKWKMGLPLLYSKQERDDVISKFLEDLYARVASAKPGCTHILDKHPGNTFEVDLVRQFFPHARFIHIIRDGREVARSLCRIHRDMGPTFGSATWDNACWQWHTYVQEGLRHRGQPWYMEMRYEDLLASGEETLQQVFDFCDIPAAPGLSAEIVASCSRQKMEQKSGASYYSDAHFSKGKEAPLSPLDAYRFHRGAGSLLQELGYVVRPAWWAGSPLHRIVVPLQHKLSLLLKLLQKRL